MKTITITLAALAVFSAGITRAEDFDFRRARWGMTPEEVRETETEAAPFGDMEGLLIYQGTIAGIEADIIYIFQNGRLERGVYSIEPAESQAVSRDYPRARSHLVELYGPPLVEKLNLEDGEAAGDLDPDDLDGLVKLVLAGGAEPMTYWETGASKIYLRLTEKDGRAAIQVDYLGRER
ncbi:MAG: hypothetical protein P9M08_06630 [Candidatus Erginobacter occultus]|nr:hypothetical protein [Candidatus Erginobacter occultus]